MYREILYTVDAVLERLTSFRDTAGLLPRPEHGVQTGPDHVSSSQHIAFVAGVDHFTSVAGPVRESEAAVVGGIDWWTYDGWVEEEEWGGGGGGGGGVGKRKTIEDKKR